MTAREATCRRKRRLRREAQARAWREWVCGGPLVDHAAPIMTSGDDRLGYNEFWRDMQRRTERMTTEGELLVIGFARGCCVRRAEELRMVAEALGLLSAAGPPHSAPLETTNPSLLQDVVAANYSAPARSVSDVRSTLPRLCKHQPSSTSS